MTQTVRTFFVEQELKKIEDAARRVDWAKDGQSGESLDQALRHLHDAIDHAKRELT